jgi:hypothetical protein
MAGLGRGSALRATFELFVIRGEAFLQQTQSTSCPQRLSWLGSLLDLSGSTTAFVALFRPWPLGAQELSLVQIPLERERERDVCERRSHT